MFSASVCTLRVETVPEDLYEQPFRSFDATYGFYPTENLTLKVKLMNLLDEAITIERDGVLVFEEKPGMAISASD
jgi:hypothetical protein